MMQLRMMVLLAAASVAPAAADGLAGKWECQHAGMPYLTLNIAEDGGRLMGSAVFFLLLNEGGTVRAGGKSENPMIAPAFDGSVLSFRVRARSHAEPILMRMKMTGPDSGHMGGHEGAPGCDLVRTPAGTWEGRVNGRPAVKLTVQPDLGGSVVFYILDGPAETARALHSALFREGVLTFRIDPEGDRGVENTSFRMRLTGADSAVLESDSASVILVRLR